MQFEKNDPYDHYAACWVTLNHAERAGQFGSINVGHLDTINAKHGGSNIYS